MRVTDHQVSTDELRAAFNRAPLLHLRGMTFTEALALPLVHWALQMSALSRRKRENSPIQPRLI